MYCFCFGLLSLPDQSHLGLKKQDKKKKKGSFLHYINIGKLLVLSFMLSLLGKLE